MDCECLTAGFCERRQTIVSPIHWQRCRAGEGELIDRFMVKAAGRPESVSAPPATVAPPTMIPQPKIVMPVVSTLGTRLRLTFESEMRAQITCGTCLAFLISLNQTTVHNRDAIVERITFDMPIPQLVRDEHKTTVERRAWIAAIVDSEMKQDQEPAMDFRKTYDEPVAFTVGAQWKSDPSAEVFFRDKLKEAVAESLAVKYPGGHSGCGIVIPAGGVCTTYGGAPTSYFWLAHTAAYVLRRTGCVLPVQFWFLPGEMEAVGVDVISIAAAVGATCHVLDTSHMRCQWGWQVKINAIMQCSFRHVLHLDADNIVRADPTYLFRSPGYEATGALFWLDDFSNVSMMTVEQLRRIGLHGNAEIRDFEAGQMLIDKARNWSSLLLTKYLADHADYWGGKNGGGKHSSVWYGDKTDFHAAWLLTGGGSFHMARPNWSPGGFFEHKDQCGRVVFQHVTQSKKSLVSGQQIAELSNRGCAVEAFEGRVAVPWLTGNPVDAAKLISPEKFFDLHDDDQCRGIWIDVVRKNEYRLPEAFDPLDILIDIGANTGAFTYAALKRGAGTVESYEPYTPSFERIQKNILSEFPAAVLNNAAVWRSDRPVTSVSLSMVGSIAAPGGFTTAQAQGWTANWTVPAVMLDDVLRKYDRIRMLKIDCEGGEWSQLYTSRELHRVQEICGEYHLGITDPDEPDGGWPQPFTGAGLRAYLESIGFSVVFLPPSEYLGLFFATRS